MKRRKIIVLLSVSIVLVGIGWAYAQQRSAPPTLTAMDYVEIQQLYSNYVRATDMGGAGDGSDYVANFSDDAEFEQSGRINKGPEALKKMIKGFHEGLKKNGWSSRHTYSNLLITPTPEGAKGSVYALIFNVTAKPPFVDHSGVYEDWLVKTPNGWKYKKRIFKPSGAFEPSLP